jgi:ActR/RegA family two-component response regulator
MNSPSPAFVGRVLLVSDDATTVEQLSEPILQLALFVEQCSDVPTALARLQRAKYEAVIVDFRLGDQAREVVEGTRKAASNEHAVVFTVSDGEVEGTEAFKAGSTFLLRRPLSAGSIDLSLKAAYGLIVRERRRYFRCPVETPVAIFGTNMLTAYGRTVNISEGGMAATAAAPIGPGDEIRLHFTLPGNNYELQIESTVCWVKEQKLGFQFLPSHQSSRLQGWLSSRLEEAMPQSVRDKFSTFPQG